MTGDITCHDHGGFKRGAVVIRSQLVYRKASSSAVVWGPSGSTDPNAIAEFAFPSPNVSDLVMQFAQELTEAGIGSGALGSITIKYAKFAADPEYMVATLMMADTEDFKNATKGFSRVILIRLSDGRFWDLTRLVEAFEGVGRGRLGALAPTSASPASGW
jgi:hypothetical protein